MKLTHVEIQRFKNIVDPQMIEVEDDVTCFIGKNEAGKTTILKALHRLNPANGSDTTFDLTTEYPRWRLARDRKSEALADFVPVTAWFELKTDELEDIDGLPDDLPPGTLCRVWRTYSNALGIALDCPAENLIRRAAEDSSLQSEDLESLLNFKTVSAAVSGAKVLTKELKDAGEVARSKAVGSFAASIDAYAAMSGTPLSVAQQSSIESILPKFFYFSTYDVLPGECDLHELAAKVLAKQPLGPAEQTVVSLLARAGEAPRDFLDDNYNSRKAELQAASADLTRHVFEYWTQNTDLDVIFDTDMAVYTPAPNLAYHRVLKIELRDGRHGGVETNFATRSSGFQWFFSFFAAFSEYQDSSDAIIVLLDEPGTSLHGEAQKDFLRFVFEELGAAKQTMYTTHSQYMVDPARYEKMRAVHDRATRQNPDLGVHIDRVSLSADRDTLLPVESALGYSISQHLFLGSGHHLAVEGSSDFVYLQRMTEHLSSKGLSGLDPRLAIIPVGGDSNMPAFVALLGRRLKVSALIDGDRSSAKLDRVRMAALANAVPDTSIVACGEIEGVPKNADIEDLFEVSDYLRLYNRAFSKSLSINDLPVSEEPILRRIEAVDGKFDHAIPAHTLTDNRSEFFAAFGSGTVERFAALFDRINATLN